jgi:hypothetical protein
VNSTGTCAAADSQPKTDTHGGDSGGQAHRLAVFLGRGRQGSPERAPGLADRFPISVRNCISQSSL